MSDFLRLRGSETQVRVTQNGVLQTTIIDIKSSEFLIKMDKKLERYLGRVGQSTDDQFSHVEGNLMFHVRSRDFLVMFDRIARRAQRQTGFLNDKFGVSSSLQFPDGRRAIIAAPDLVFGDLPIRASGGDAYVETTLDWASETYKLQLI
jgi:hypothetical protein